MEYFFLVIHLSSSSVVIPEKYTSLSDCDSAGTQSKQTYICVRAPDYACSSLIQDEFGNMRPMTHPCSIVTGQH